MNEVKVRTTEAILDGSQDKFSQLVLEHHRKVRVFLSRYVHCPGQVDDLAQEVFVAGYKQLDQFQGKSKVSTWLLGIARNKALQFLRTEIRRRDKQQQFSESLKYRNALGYLKQESDIATTEARLDALQLCIRLLPDPAKRLVDKFYFQNQSSVSIGLETDQNDGAIRMKLKRIRGVLQKCIASKLPNYETIHNR